MNKMLAFLFSMVMTNILLAEKVLIITHSYCRPDFIEMQDRAFKALLQDDYEYVVFNDAQNDDMARQIAAMCQKLTIRCIRIPQTIHTQPYLPRLPHESLQAANVRHANCVQFSLDKLGFDHDGIVFIIDSDMLPTKLFSISRYMEDKDIAAFIKYAPNGVYCLCPAMCMLYMNRLPDKRTLNFNTGIINGSPADSGGWTYYYLTAHPEVRLTRMTTLYSHQLFLGDKHINRQADVGIPKEVKKAFYRSLGFNDIEMRFLLKEPDTFEYYLDNYFVHYRGGSTDKHEMANNRKLQIFTEFLDETIASL